MRYFSIAVTAYAQNASVIYCPDSRAAALIDPGGDLDRILDQARQHRLEIERILITHGHFDHCGAALDLAEQLGIPIEGPHQGDAFLLQSLHEWAQMAGFPPARNFTPDRWLDEGDEVRIGSQCLHVLHCPGHTPGHLVFHDPDRTVAFVGDVLFKGSIGRTDFPRGNHQQLLDSIHRKLLPLGDSVRFVPGHGPTSTLGDERLHNPFLQA